MGISVAGSRACAVMTNSLVAVTLALSVTRAVNRCFPAGGLPRNVPAALSVSHDGSDPASGIQLYGGVPPLDARVYDQTTPTTPLLNVPGVVMIIGWPAVSSSSIKYFRAVGSMTTAACLNRLSSSLQWSIFESSSLRSSYFFPAMTVPEGCTSMRG